MARERSRLAAHALHHVSVAAEGVNVVIEQFVIRAIEMLCQPLPGNRHPDAGGNSLAQRAGRGLHTGGVIKSDANKSKA